MTSSTREELKGTLATQPKFDPSKVDMKRPTDVGTIRQLIESQKGELARALPKHLDADRLARIAFTTIRSNRGLAICTPESLLGGLMTCAQLGLEPGPLDHAYFVPFKNEVTFILGYKGMIELALRSGKIVSLIAREVYENDEFDVAYGLEDALRHKPKILGDRGKVVAYYAVAKLVGGGHAFVVLSRDDVEKIRKRSRAKDSGPWQSDYDAMAKKTCVRRLFTYLPTSVEMVQALGQDGQVRTEVEPEVLDTPPVFVDGEVVHTDDAGPVDAGSGEVLDGTVVDGVPVEDPDEPAWPDTAQPADAK
jgi:recombination protein RecT